MPTRPSTNATTEATDIERLVRTIETRVLHRLRRCGRLTDLDGADSSTHDPSLFDTIRAAAILGITRSDPAKAAAIHGCAKTRPAPTSTARCGPSFTAGSDSVAC